MGKGIYQEGGPYNNRKVGKDKHVMQIPIDTDEFGRIARECCTDECIPGYFKIKFGTGIQEELEYAFCPYCGIKSEMQNFMTEEQLRYMKDVLSQEVMIGFTDSLKNSLGLGTSGRKKIGGGEFMSMEISMGNRRREHISKPNEDEVQRDIVCPNCTLDHVVYGYAVWCPDCGCDIFITHVEAEYNLIKDILKDVKRREKEVSKRAAKRDLENCLEDVVSSFESLLRFITVRKMKISGDSEEHIAKIFSKKIGNRFQNPESAKEIIKNRFGALLFEEKTIQEIEFLKNTFQKRHTLTHNSGVVDKKYLDKTSANEKEGREIKVTEKEILESIRISISAIENLCEKLFKS